MATLSDPVAYLSEHYVYEVNMLRWTHAMLAMVPESFPANALIESFCVHARALWDFYSPPQNPQRDDVLARDFATSWTHTTTATSQLATDLRTRINKQIAHLTTGRENPSKKVDTADRQALLTAIEADHAAFKSAVDQQFANCFIDELKSTLTIQVPAQGSLHLPSGSPSATNAVQFSGTSSTSQP